MSDLVIQNEWIDRGGNETLECGWGYISYNPNTSFGMGGIFDGDGAETALCKDEKYYILNGDFRETYESLNRKGGWDECLKYYKLRENECGSSWSTG